MNIKSLNAVSCTGKMNAVKEAQGGKDYQVTNSGKISGSLGGAILGGIGCYSESKKHNLDEIAHSVNMSDKSKYVLFCCSVYAAIGFGIGALIDLFVNTHRAEKADIKAQK